MNHRDRIKRWLVCARLIDRQYASLAGKKTNSHKPVLAQIADAAGQLRHYQEHIDYAVAKGWSTAASAARNDNLRHLRRLQRLVEQQVQACSGARADSDFRSTRAELIRDLRVIEKEFARVVLDVKAKQLRVTSADVQLDGLQLGAFEIVLDLETLADANGAYYEVIAVDGNYAQSDDDVTHPHIQANRLCEGDAQPTIKLALRQGRLLDFFQIVEQVLQTYNPASAYVKIKDWQGCSCGHCGSLVSDDDLCHCSDCATDACNECVYSCVNCDATVCGRCERTCEGCCEAYCDNCSAVCSTCDQSYCKCCFNSNERCDSCEEKTKEESNVKSTEATVHADRVGSVAVPA